MQHAAARAGMQEVQAREHHAQVGAREGLIECAELVQEGGNGTAGAILKHDADHALHVVSLDTEVPDDVRVGKGLKQANLTLQGLRSLAGHLGVLARGIVDLLDGHELSGDRIQPEEDTAERPRTQKLSSLPADGRRGGRWCPAANGRSGGPGPGSAGVKPGHGVATAATSGSAALHPAATRAARGASVKHCTGAHGQTGRRARGLRLASPGCGRGRHVFGGKLLQLLVQLSGR